MKEMFDWVPWFNELAKKIAGGGQQYLDDRAREVDWHGESPLPSAEAIDPLFFITVVANESGKAESRSRVFASLAEVFEIHPLESDDSPDVWHAPTSLRLFQYDNPADPANREVVWRLLRATVSGSLDAETFESANGRLRNISWAKLTTTLALIDATSHLRLSKGYPEAYGVAKVAGEPRWTDYQSRVADARANFPGCELYEIEMFARLQSSTNEGGHNVVVDSSRCWIVSTKLGEPGQRSDHWHDFDRNRWVRTGQDYSGLSDANAGDVVLVRCGVKEGRGIGVVLRNDYDHGWKPDGALHVVWLNKSDAPLSSANDGVQQTRREAFGQASERELSLFRGPSEYRPTWEALDSRPQIRTLREPGILKTWNDFLAAWPPDRVRDMSLEEYTNLDRETAFIYWLEKKTESLGSIWGVSAFKFGIYRRRDKDPREPSGGRLWGDDYAWMSKYGETAEAAFATVRSLLAEVIDAAKSGNLAAVDAVDLWPFVKWKVAFLYQDREDPRFLALYSQELLGKRYNEAFPGSGKPPPSQQHAALIEHYSWLGDSLDISPRIWLAPEAQPAPERLTPSPSDTPADVRYWLMSLGRQSRRWPGCYESGTASIGYDRYNVGDLRQYGSLEKVGRAIESDARSWPMHDRLALWEFSHVMRPGDVIFVKRGNDAIGHGAVRSDYRYDGTRDSHRHVRDVKWESNFPDGVRVREKPLVVKTLTDITKYPDQVRAFKQALQIGFNELDPVSWTPDPCRRRYPRCRDQDPRTQQSSVARWWIWSGPGAARTI